MNRLSLRDVVVAAISGALCAVAAVWLTRYAGRTLINWQATADVVAHFATAVGVVAAGIWAWRLSRRRRSLVPRAELVHRHQLWHDARGPVLRVIVEIRNPSEVILHPGDGMTHVQVPPADPIDPPEYAYDEWTDIAEIRHAPTFEAQRIEPKESEVLAHDVRLPPNTRYVQLYTWIACERDGKAPTRATSGDRPTTAYKISDDAESWSVVTLIDLEAPAQGDGSASPSTAGSTISTPT